MIEDRNKKEIKKEGTTGMKDPRPIKSNLKSKRFVWEEDKPIRWSFMKILREYSTIKREYAVNPYAEVYQFRENLYAIFTESLDGMGDPWMFLIDGPEKAMLIDTGFGVGDLKGLVKEIVGDKPLVVVNTHSHFDHAYGNSQFETIYCHKYEVPRMEKVNNSHIWDYLFDKNGNPKWTKFDRKDIVPYHKYEIIGVEDGHLFDLGNGYFIEAVLLPGHTPGQCAFYDKVNHTIFIGDTTSILPTNPTEPYREYCSVEALNIALKKLQTRFDEIDGVFPGHGMLDQPSISLQYLLDATQVVMDSPERYDTVKNFKTKEGAIPFYSKYIFQGSDLKYTDHNIFMKGKLKKTQFKTVIS